MPGERRKIRGQIVLYYFTVILIYFLDQLSKFSAVRLLRQGSSTPVIENIFHLTLVHNTGAAFGIMKSHPYLFIIAAFLATVIITLLLIKKGKEMTFAEKISLCFIMGGTLGNLTDRLRFGYVIDFIDLRIWPVFNIADSFITIGACLLAWSIFKQARKGNK